MIVDKQSWIWYTLEMYPRILIPVLWLAIACLSSVAYAGGTHTNKGTHVHMHKHGGTTHLHTHSESHKEHERRSCDYACEDEAHEDCCGDHDHLPEQFRDAYNARERELPTCSGGMIAPLTYLSTASTPISLLRWAPLRQRPPDYLRALRTCVMLN